MEYGSACVELSRAEHVMDSLFSCDVVSTGSRTASLCNLPCSLNQNRDLAFKTPSDDDRTGGREGKAGEGGVGGR